jgi:phage terminase Nu1 subunit (DNA packaging protein)
LKRYRSPAKLPKAPPPTLKKFAEVHSDVPKHVLDKLYVESKTRYVDTREKRSRLQLAKERGDLIEKRLAVHQLTFLFVAMRQKMLNAPLCWHRKFMHITDPHVARDRLTELMLSLLKELHDMPKKAIDPNWLETLDEEEA